MKPIFVFLSVFFMSFLFLFVMVTQNHADQLDDITNQINSLTSQLNESINATTPLESQVNSMQQQIASIKSQVAGINVDIAQKQAYINKQYQDIARQEKILGTIIRDYYIKTSSNNTFLTLISTNSLSKLTNVLAYQEAALNQDKSIITNLALSITDLQQQQTALQSEEARLTVVKANLDDQSAKLDKIIQGAKQYQASLSSQIAVLSAQQQQLLAAKYATLGIPTTAYTTSGGCSSDIGKDPGFSPKFGFFTYGVPNRVGMDQYGAKGRADAGQSYNDILNAYYQNFTIASIDTGTQIHVVGTNEYGESFDTQWDIETYVKHIYEIPTSWSSEALKAQAIAARSYAMATTNNGASSICPSQSCQVVKQEINDGNWQAAVDATRGQVMESGGQPIKAWFSSTHGGYVFSSSDIGWSGTSYTKEAQDTNGSVGSFADLQAKSYDRASPWFYCDWGSRASNNNTAWLTANEVADIVNVITLAQADSSVKEHLYQTDQSNPAGTDTWDASRVRQELQNRNITPYNSVSDISVNADFGVGKVTTVTVTGDAGTKSFAGDFFKTYFNLRAPANIQIVGPLYNIER